MKISINFLPLKNCLCSLLLIGVLGMLGMAQLEAQNCSTVWPVAPEIYPGQFGGSPNNFTEYKGVLYFIAGDADHGRELWKRDGTNPPEMVYDIHPSSSGLYSTYELIEYKDDLYFKADDGDSGNELFKFDGTNPPELVADLWTGPQYTWSNIPASSSPENFVVVGDYLYFTASHKDLGTELWIYDGVDPPKVIDIYNGSSSSSPANLTIFQGDLYLTARSTGWNGIGTYTFKVEGENFTTFGGALNSMFVFGDDLYYWSWSYDGSTYANRLWQYNGIDEPNAVLDANNSQIKNTSYFFDPAVIFDNHIVFPATTDDGQELVKYDGTNTPTSFDLYPGLDQNGNQNNSFPRNLKVIDGKLYFNAVDATKGKELWIYDGTNQPEVIDVVPGEDGNGNPLESNPTPHLGYNGDVLFSADTEDEGVELWKYDGTNAPSIVKDIYRGKKESSGDLVANNSNPSDFNLYNGTLYFRATNENGSELWIYGEAPDNGIDVIGNSISITNGDDTPDEADYTDFGSESFRTFTIENTGVEDLTIAGVYFSGTDQSNFRITNGAGISTLPPNGSTELELYLNTCTPGTYTDTVVIYNNDCNKDPFTFKISRTVAEVPDGPCNMATRFANLSPDDPYYSGSNPDNFALMNGKMYFSATGTEGSKLWEYDGSDLTQVENQNFSSPSRLFIINNELHFTANGPSGFGFWKYDGINPPSEVFNLATAGLYSYFNFSVFDDKIYFLSSSSSHPQTYWVYDGTGPATVAWESSGFSSIGSLIPYNGILYFNATLNGEDNLFEYDGMSDPTILADRFPNVSSIEGTGNFVFNDLLYIRIYDFSTGENSWLTFDGTNEPVAAPELNNFYVNEYAIVNNALYFTYPPDYNTGSQLYKYDGVNPPTFIYDTNINGKDEVKRLTEHNGELYFVADDEFGENRLFRYDGAGPPKVITTVDGSDLHMSQYATNMMSYDGYLYFAAGAHVGISVYNGSISVRDVELWRYGAQPHTEIKVKGNGMEISKGDVTPDESDYTDFGESISRTFIIQNPSSEPLEISFVYFTGLHQAHFSHDIPSLPVIIPAGEEIDFQVAVEASITEEYNATINLVSNDCSDAFFQFDLQKTVHPWGESGCLAEIVEEMSGSPRQRFVWDDKLFFMSYDAEHGLEAWFYDGSNPPTMLTDDGVGGAGFYRSMTDGIALFNGELYFSYENKSDGGGELWKWDGSNSPTLVADIYTGTYIRYGDELPNNSYPTHFAVYDNKLFFSAENEDGRELWSYDGTSAEMVEDIFPGIRYGTSPNSSNVKNLIAYDGKLYFSATTGEYGEELWSYDGTAVELVEDIHKQESYNGNTRSSEPQDFFKFNGKLYFSAAETSNWQELWEYDGTDLNKLADIYPTLGTIIWSHSFTIFNNKLYFAATEFPQNNSFIDRLYEYDGTNAPTRVVEKDLDISELTLLDGALYFKAEDNLYGQEIWRFNGTGDPEAFMDINVGTGHSYPHNFFVLNGLLYFQASNGSSSNLYRYTPNPSDSEINLEGNNEFIENGDDSPSEDDHTNFASATSRTFTINNPGGEVLDISEITLSGDDAGLFSISSAPTSVAANGSTTFEVNYTGPPTGMAMAVVELHSDDCDEDIFDFAIQTSCESEIAISGNSMDITDGHDTPTEDDHTDFGSATSRTFTIENTGTTDLEISAINLIGANNADFSIGGIDLPTTILPNGSETFTVDVVGTPLYVATAKVEVVNNDCDELLFDFTVQYSSCAAEIEVSGNGSPINDGDGSVSVTNHTDFQLNLSRTFGITNSGMAPLTLSGITLSGTNANDFSVMGLSFPTDIAPAGTSYFNIELAPGSQGVFDATVHIESNDCDESDFDFAIKADIPTCPSGNVLFVDAGAAGLNNGRNWYDAFTTLHAALDSDCPGITEIWVAEGTYLPTNMVDRNASFTLRNGLAIYGGFNGSEESVNARKWKENETILSGDIGAIGDNSDNSFHVVKNISGGINGTAILDGFTITAGHADYVGDDESGGGMFNKSASPTIRNCNLKENSAGDRGGAVYNKKASPVFENCTFEDNSANVGGATANYTSGSPNFLRCQFNDNTANQMGGAVFSNDATANMEACSFDGNMATNQGGAIFNISASPNLVNCTFLGNMADEGAAIGNMVNSSPDIINSTFHNNDAGAAGGTIRNHSGCSPNVTNCILWGNHQGTGGEEITSSLPGPTVSHSIVWMGGGVYPGTNNHNMDPMLVSSDDLRIIPCSPAIGIGLDAANTSTEDMGEQPRKLGTIDLGAYECQVDTAVPCTWTGSGDGQLWNDPMNWSDEYVPGPCRDVIIPDGNTVIVSTGEEALGKTLTVELGAEVVTEPAATMEVRDN